MLLGMQASLLSLRDPVLPDGKPFPTEPERCLLRKFFFAGERPRGRKLLTHELVKYWQRNATDAELEKVLANLIARRLIETADNPWPDYLAPDQKVGMAEDPWPREQCYRTTALGRKAVHALMIMDYSGLRGWLLNKERLDDQVLLATTAAPVHFTQIDERCCEANSEEVMATLERLVVAHLVGKTNSGEYVLTIQGEARKAKVEHELKSFRSTSKAGMSAVKIFISHASSDEALARAFVDCLEDCMEIPDKTIRCTSLPGYSLAPGDVTDEELRDNLERCSMVIGLLTKESLNSGWVIMELGAAWGLNTPTCAVLAPGVPFDRIPGPLARRHAVKADIDHHVVSLIDAIAEKAALSMKNRAKCTAAVSAFVAQFGAAVKSPLQVTPREDQARPRKVPSPALSKGFPDSVRTTPQSNASSPSNPRRAAPHTASAYVISDRDIYELLRLSRFSSESSSNYLQWARGHILMQTPSDHSSNEQAFQALLVCWLLAEVEQAVRHVGWIEQDKVHNAIKVLIGLKASSISAPDKLALLATDAITSAVKFAWLQEEQHDAWRPGMESGTGWTSRLSVTAVGRKVLIEAGVTELPTNGEDADSAIDDADVDYVPY